MKVPVFFLSVILIFALAILALNFYLGKTVSDTKHPNYGVSFSPIYAKYLGLDWKKMYSSMFEDLKIKRLRLSTSWDKIEPQKGKYNFDDVDYIIATASAKQVPVLLVVGGKQPRWPECHLPEWAKGLETKQRQQETLNFISAVVERYKDNPIIYSWQVENEPLFGFGENCPLPDLNFLKEEITLVKQLDPKRPVTITDTGEWSSWIKTMSNSDILGISLYRKAINPLLGEITYPIPASFYNLKSKLVRKIFAPKNLRTEIDELQAEPWTKDSILQTPLEKQIQLFSLNDFKQTLNYARQTGFETIYLWGVEWWYWMDQQGHPEYLNFGQSLLQI